MDSSFSHKDYANKPRKTGGVDPIRIPLLSDPDHNISKDYGVLINFGVNEGTALRGTFIIDDNQILRYIYVNDLPVGRNIEETLRVLEEIQICLKETKV